jgi:hypothetical protein
MRPFHHFEASTHDERIVTGLRFVDESNRRMRAATRRDGIVGTIDELHAQVLVVADSKVRSIRSWAIGRKRNGCLPPASIRGQELDQDLCESSHPHYLRTFEMRGSRTWAMLSGIVSPHPAH